MTCKELWTQYKQEPSVELKRQIVLKYTKLVHYVINKSKLIDNNVVDYEDYFQIGVEGLSQAIERYNPEYGTKFETYAFLRIKGKIIDEVRKLNITSYLSKNNASKSQVLSLDHNISSDNSTLYLYDVVPTDDIRLDDLVINKEMKSQLAVLIKKLNSRDRKILALYYFENLKYKDIANILGLTIPRISQLHSKIIKKLKEKMNLVYENN